VMWQRQPDPVPGEFAGRTSQEAVRLARAEYGRDAPVRCWKTRRGGIFGFFTTEAFVAGIEPPPGAIKAVNTTRPARTRPEREETRGRQTEVRESAPPNSPEQVSLSQLVEGTSDEVTLGSDPLPDAVFSEVLAEAQAAVSGGDVLTQPQPQPQPQRNPEPLAPPVPSSGVEQERIEGLVESLAALGVPIEYRPHDAEATLDGLARALDNLPVAPPIPNIGGSVIAVVGARRDAHAAAHQLSACLGLEPSDLIAADPTDSYRLRMACRRVSNEVTLVWVEASLRTRRLPDVSGWLQKVRPDYVLGVVPATAKRSDVAHWGGQLGRIDALAVVRLADTTTPGELMGGFPISLIDGMEASTLRWVWRLLGATLQSGQ